MRGKIKFSILIGILIFSISGIKTSAQESLLDEMDFTDVEQMLDETMPEKVSFREMVQNLVSGKIPLNKDTVIQLLEKTLLSQLKSNASLMVYILLLAMLSAVLTNFTKMFRQSQIADISFYIVYMLLLAVLLKSFQAINEIAESVLGQMTEFMQVLIPTYTITIAAAKGGTTAAAFYEFLIALVYGISFVLFRIVLPFCNVYVILKLVNSISKEDMLSKTAELVKTLIEWALKTMLAIVIGMNVVQGLITPAVDTFKTSAIHKAVTAVPGVGNTMSAVTEVVIGSGMLIKNGVGVGILVVLVLVSLVPIAKLAILILLYRMTAAAVQPVSDKRLLSCIQTVGEGSGLLLRCVNTAFVLFFITIAILTVSTSL